MKILALLLTLITAFAWPTISYAQLQSENYQLKDYSVGVNTTDPDTGSSSFKIYAESDAVGGSLSDMNSLLNSGLQYALQAATPLTPTFENPASYYDRLKFTLDPGDDPTDVVYAIAISDDDFVTTKYISKELTIIDNAEDDDWQTFDTWGGEEGAVVTGLSSNTEYKIRVTAKQGEFTQSNFSP